MFLSGCSCSCTDFFIVRWIAEIMGIVLNALYELLSKLDIANIGLCIILFTIIVKLLMLPMAIKQQKFTRLSSVMNPELQAIQNKYKNKTDQESMIRMREETNAVYEKYGTSASSGCMQLLIQMPIIFALYAVISSIPSHVSDVSLMYKDVSAVAYESIEQYEGLDDISSLLDIEVEIDDKKIDFSALIKEYNTDINDDEEVDVDDVYKQFTNINNDAWDDFDKMYASAEFIIDELKSMSEEDWNTLIEDADEDDVELLEKYKDADYDKLLSELKINNTEIENAGTPINDVYKFAGINLAKSPSSQMSTAWWAILIPILSALTQWLSVKISQASTKSNSGNEDNPMLQSMNMTMMFMPLMSAFLCYTFQSGLGLYWVVSSVVQIFQQIFINKYFSKLEVNDIIRMNIEKVNKKRAAQGLPPRKITEVATINVKNIKVENKPQTNTKPAVTNTNTNTTSSGKKTSMAAKANMVKDFNERNNKK